MPDSPDHDDATVLNEDLQELVIGLRKNLRHAVQGDRICIQWGPFEDEKADYFGDQFFWPVIMVQAGLLRHVSRIVPTTRSQQSDLYRLEAILEEELLAKDPVIGRECMAWLDSFNVFPDGYLPQFVADSAYPYICDGPERFQNLPSILNGLDPDAPEYKAYRTEFLQSAAEDNCEPWQIWSMRPDWPDFTW